MIDNVLETNILSLRPGLLGGRYPERVTSYSHHEGSVINAFMSRLNWGAQQKNEDLLTIAQKISTLGESLRGMDDACLSLMLQELRLQFARQGLSDALCCKAFALIREIAGRQLDQRHYAEQLMGGWVMLQGQLAEMATGEGKTLTVTLPAATAALAGIPVHVITANEYLVRRDAETMGPLYRALGLSVGYVTEEMSFAKRQAAYGCDITYCTNKQVAFDYLRDRLLRIQEKGELRQRLQESTRGKKEQLLLRGLCFALVDEADHVLIDEARTPLILTRTQDASLEEYLYPKAFALAQVMAPQQDFIVENTTHRVQLTRAGAALVADACKGREQAARQQRRLLELVQQGLFALHLLQRDRDYLVANDKVLIIDEKTGRIMADRSWERGLQQLVELKESCPLSEPREHLGRLTYQSFFRRYLHMGGMSGTIAEVQGELRNIYNLRVREIGLRQPSRRQVLPGKIFMRAEEKWLAVVGEVQSMRQKGRPVLIGTGSVADSEQLSARLAQAGIKHQVLNARQDSTEAAIVASAGARRQVTVATNMAGRGTDIPLGPGGKASGGLHVIATCCNESVRIDRQLIGRCARQGDPGSSRSLLSLDDPLIQVHGSLFLRRLLQSPLFAHLPLSNRLKSWACRKAQISCEHVQRKARRDLLQSEEAMNRLLAFSGEAL